MTAVGAGSSPSQTLVQVPAVFWQKAGTIKQNLILATGLNMKSKCLPSY